MQLVRLGAALACAALLAAAPRGPAPVNVTIQTSTGTIVVALDVARAPVTVKNFLHLVDTHAYDGASFYRTVVAAPPRPRFIEVIQGGLGDKAAGLTPIPIEPTTKTGLHNTQGAIAMARTADPNSASSEFFIDVGDDTVLDAQKFSDGAGYAAFGHVVRGYDVVLKIHRAHADGEAITPPVRIVRMTRAR
jgi:peptidyl-prolyl cis-trans isomerase A (cyclophilin A)